jgi:hypothetical protein
MKRGRNDVSVEMARTDVNEFVCLLRGDSDW